MRPLVAIILSFGCLAVCPAAAAADHVVVMVWDGMRPDFITETNTPTLYRLAHDGVFFAHHHSVYPSATEVNGTALSTGAYPAHSGIVANKEYRPRINLLKAVSTESPEAVRGGDYLTQGHYLNVATVAEIVQAAGRRTAVAGTKPVALLPDRRERRAGQGLSQVLCYDRTLPTNSWTELLRLAGPYPAYGSPNVGRDAWTTRVLTGPFWGRDLPAFSMLWMSEPDYSQHDTGPGSATSLAALRSSDANLRRVLEELDRRGLRGRTDVLVVSDHGFSTITQTVDVAGALQNAGFRATRDFYDPPRAGDVFVVSNGGATLLYVIGRDAALVRRVVDFLQRQEFTGVLFTRQPVEGAFTLDKAMMHSGDAPDILLALRWSDGVSSNGTPGLVFCDEATRKPGQGMHVTLSRYDMHNTLVAAGPDFRRSHVDDLPTGNLDIAPTVLWVLGIRLPRPMDGRVLTEALAIPGPPVGAPVTTRIDAARHAGKLTWRQYLQRTQLNGVLYFDEGNGASASR